mmetsp:Transcript_10137/g.33255  ORF Transcript_10137/g.33255 Transcript_10137/m.33255 type:complete len:182 (+) Transcript_10137:764-1309(+)
MQATRSEPGGIASPRCSTGCGSQTTRGSLPTDRPAYKMCGYRSREELVECELQDVPILATLAETTLAERSEQQRVGLLRSQKGDDLDILGDPRASMLAWWWDEEFGDKRRAGKSAERKAWWSDEELGDKRRAAQSARIIEYMERMLRCNDSAWRNAVPTSPAELRRLARCRAAALMENSWR